MILNISGFDPSSGAGIAADIKTASKLQTYLSNIITCLTVQNSKEFQSTNPVDNKIITDQINIILDDISIDLIKIGLLPNLSIMQLLGKMFAEKIKNSKIFIDPIITSTTGKKILQDQEISFLKNQLLAKSYLITPNISEAEILSDIVINNIEDMKNAARKLQKLGCKNILIKGGHLKSPENRHKIHHFLLKEDREEVTFEKERIDTNNLEVRGTGCTFTTAICCFFNKKNNLEQAIINSDKFMNQSIKKTKKIGQKLIII